MGDDEEKTEEPTDKKIDDARKKGNVPKSQDFGGFIGLLVSSAVIIIFFQFITERLEKMYIQYLQFFETDITVEMILNLTIFTAQEMVIILLPIIIPLLIAGILSNVMQFGFLFSIEPIMPKFEKIDPINGLKNLFSMEKVIMAIKITLKVSISFTVGMVVFLLFINELQTVAMFDLRDQLVWLKEKIWLIIAYMLAIFMVFGLVDIFLSRYQYFNKLKMSKQEIKDEFKNMEGNPEIKRKIRQIQMQTARKRMLSSIPSADVVITNPTHYAVALRYDQSKEKAPRVVAKGIDNLAFKIIDLAKENQVQIVQNPPLARDLYKNVKLDDEIPSNLYKAVSVVLAFVYKANNKNKNL